MNKQKKNFNTRSVFEFTQLCSREFSILYAMLMRLVSINIDQRPRVIIQLAHTILYISSIHLQ